MGISIPKIITIDEFKGSEIYDIALGDDTVAYSDNFILEAISMATMNMDQLSGFQLMKNIDTLEQSDLDYVKFGACKYVNHLLRKGPEYLRGSGASTLGGANFSQTNPDDPYYIPPEVWTALQKVGMLADFVVGNFKTPATATSGFSYTTRGDKFFEDGNFAVTVREGNAWYVRYDRVQSSDNTVKISLGNDVDRKVLNITLNTDGIISALESNTSFKNIVLSATMKNIDKIIDAVFSQLIKDEGLIASITKSVEDIILDDEQFKGVIENAIEKLLTNDSDFLTNVEEKLKGDLVFTTEIGRIMASNESIINAIATNQDLINTISNGVKEQLTGMLQDTFVDLVDNTVLPSFDGQTIKSFIESNKTDIKYGFWFYKNNDLNNNSVVNIPLFDGNFVKGKKTIICFVSGFYSASGLQEDNFSFFYSPLTEQNHLTIWNSGHTEIVFFYDETGSDEEIIKMAIKNNNGKKPGYTSVSCFTISI
jgi:hypothetical protein